MKGTADSMSSKSTTLSPTSGRSSHRGTRSVFIPPLWNSENHFQDWRSNWKHKCWWEQIDGEGREREWPILRLIKYYLSFLSWASNQMQMAFSWSIERLRFGFQLRIFKIFRKCFLAQIYPDAEHFTQSNRSLRLRCWHLKRWLRPQFLPSHFFSKNRTDLQLSNDCVSLHCILADRWEDLGGSSISFTA